VVDYGCYWFSEECVPYEPFSIEFNNPLDESAFSEDLISVSPEIPGMTINGYGSFIVISGETGGQTTYTVTISKDLQDEFGQRLGKDEKLIFKVGKADPRLIGPEKYFVTLDPSSRKPVFLVYAVNYNQLKVQIYAVKPADWEEFTEYFSNWQQSDRDYQIPGELVLDEMMDLDLPDDVFQR